MKLLMFIIDTILKYLKFKTNINSYVRVYCTKASLKIVL